MVVQLQAKLKDALSGSVEALLDSANSDTWPKIRILLKHETQTAVSRFSDALSGFDMDDQARQKIISSLVDYARGVAEEKAKEEAGRVLIRIRTGMYFH